MPTDVSKYTYTPTTEHGIVGVDQGLGAYFKARCRCGFEGKAAPNPSTAFGYGRDHVIRESSVVSPAESGEPPGTQARSVTLVARVALRKTAAPCACLCGGTTGGGRYLPGHDSRHLKNLTTRINSGDITLSDALLVLEASPKLAAKLAKRLSN